MSLASVFKAKPRRDTIIGALVALLLVMSCKEEGPSQAELEQQQAAAQQAREQAEAAKRLEEELARKKAEEEAKKPLIVKDAGFMTPESVLFIEEEDIYLVSNINGSPSEADNNGFISRVDPDGKVAELKWIAGGQKEVTLNAPKGMAIREGTLYVTDISAVRMFDAKTGAAKGEIKIKGATFLNDLSVAPNGTLYLSDSGLKSGEQGMEPTGSDAIYTIDNENKPKKLIANKELNRPNGLLAEDDGVWVVTYGSAELYRVAADGTKGEPTKLPAGSLDGLARTADGSLLISSWEAETVYRGKPGGTFETMTSQVKSPADIAYDAKRNHVVIPVFMEDALHMEKLGPPQAMALKPGAPEPEVAAERAEAEPAKAETAKAGEEAAPAKAEAKAKPAKAEQAAKPAKAEDEPAKEEAAPKKAGTRKTE